MTDWDEINENKSQRIESHRQQAAKDFESAEALANNWPGLKLKTTRFLLPILLITVSRYCDIWEVKNEN